KASMNSTSSRRVGSLAWASGTDAILSSEELEPESGSVSTSCTSNSRALTMMKQTFSDEMPSVGSAIASSLAGRGKIWGREGRTFNTPTVTFCLLLGALRYGLQFRQPHVGTAVGRGPPVAARR